MAETREQRIKKFLSERLLAPEDVPPDILRYLAAVDDAIQKRFSVIESIKKKPLTDTISISSVSKDTGISRKTFYNNVLLKEYVEMYSCKDQNVVITREELDTAKEHIRELTEQIKLFNIRDIDIEELKQENVKLRKEIDRLKALNKELTERYDKLQSKNDELMRGTAKPHIVCFHNEDKA